MESSSSTSITSTDTVGVVSSVLAEWSRELRMIIEGIGLYESHHGRREKERKKAKSIR